MQDPPLALANPSQEIDTIFVRCLNSLFRWIGGKLARYSWPFLLVSVTFTLVMSAAIPFTKMTNDVSDFTPYAARARSELTIYEDFFSNEGEPIVIAIMITRKDEGSMLGLRELNETVRILDDVTNQIYLRSSISDKSVNFMQFCSSFCNINEPVRNFYSGMVVQREFNESTPSIDLGYPLSRVLGRKFNMDTNFFGVQVEITDSEGKREVVSLDKVVSVNGRSVLDSENGQLQNNVRDVRLVVLQLRAQKPSGFLRQDVERYETEVVNYLKKNLSSEVIETVAFATTYLKSEIVRTGLQLAPFTVFGFFIMCLFSSGTATLSALAMSQMNAGKIVIALTACVCPFMACGTALGLLFWSGMRFGSILLVTPFLVLAIGVDDAFLMINSWQNNNRRLRMFPQRDQHGNPRIAPVSERISAMLEDIGPSVTITTLTNILAFGIGALTPTPEIRLFSIGNAVAMLFDLIYQVTMFGSVMAIVTKWEVEQERKALDEKPTDELLKPSGDNVLNTLKRGMDKYCSIICNKYMSAMIMALLALYWGVCIYGTVTMRPELKPEKLFAADSDLNKVMKNRNKYVVPYYTVCYVFVNKPGNISNPRTVRKLNNLVEDFENLPRALGRFSTKFWLRDYEQFIQDSESSIEEDDSEFMNSTEVESNVRIMNELENFLDWPEFRFWKGFIQHHRNARGELELDKFFFTTASHGVELNIWSQRAALLQEWRSIADKYPEMEVSVYEDDAKFMDLIPTLVSQTAQSSVGTFICMIFVCMLFIKRVPALVIATCSIVSTCIGVLGILSLWGVDLDPLVMSAMIMSIGFSVDIPSHVTYHFYKTKGSTFVCRLQNCMSAIAFPVLQATLSTLLCVLSLLFVPIHMSIVFVKTMVLVVLIGLVHGLLIIPVAFNLFNRACNSTVHSHSNKKSTQNAIIFMNDVTLPQR